MTRLCGGSMLNWLKCMLLSRVVLGALCALVTVVANAQSVPGLVGYWTFNEGSGTAAADSSGSGDTAALVNGVTWTQGKLGGAISVNGVNQYGSIPAVNLAATNAVTVTMWLNRTYATSGGGSTLLEATANFNNSATGF